MYVQKEAEDLWCEGANLRTGLIGIFPIAHVVDVDYREVQLNLTPEMQVFYMLLERSFSIFSMASLKQHIK